MTAEHLNLAKLGSLLQPRLTKFIVHKPTPKQAAFLALTCADAFYGGAAGGGKSDALLMAALQYVDVPEYAALLLRDSYSNLMMPGALIDRANTWLYDTDAKWDSEAKTWRFPTGATLTFGYLDGPQDHLKYKSAEFQFIGIDEAGDLKWKQINFMFSRLRKLQDFPCPIRFRLASNPGGISHMELKTKYVDVRTREKNVIFIPAGLKDNPYLDQEEYVKSLNKLDPITRAQLLEGDWNVKESGMFKREWFKVTEELPVIGQSVRYWDLAATEAKKGNDPAYTTGLKMKKTPENLCCIEAVTRGRWSPHGVESMVTQCAHMDGRNTEIWMEQEPGSSGVAVIDHYARNILPGFVFRGDKVTGSKSDRARPLASYAEAGNVYIANNIFTSAFLDEVELFPDGKFKDQVDACSGAFNKLFGGHVEPRIRVI